MSKLIYTVSNALGNNEIQFIVKSDEEMVRLNLKLPSQHFTYLLASEYLEFLEANFPIEKTYEIPLKGDKKTAYIMVADHSIQQRLNDQALLIEKLKEENKRLRCIE